MDPESHICQVLGLQSIHIASLFGKNEDIVRLAASATQFNVDMPTKPASPQRLKQQSWPRGETALMLATLMGHLETAELLISLNAQVDKRNSFGYTATNYYAVTEASKSHRSFYLRNKLGQEHPDAENARLAILHFLNSPAHCQFTQRIGDAGYVSIHLAKVGSKLVASAPFASANMGKSLDRQKEVACLTIFNQHKPILWAKSGFAAKRARADAACVDGKKMADIARNCIAPNLDNFRFQPHMHDYGKRTRRREWEGRFKASHAEVQLSTAYILRLVQQHCPHLGNDQSSITKKQLNFLKTANLGADQRRVAIHMYSWPCISCKQYLERLAKATRVLFHPVSGIGSRRVRRKKKSDGQLQDCDDEIWSDSEDEGISCSNSKCHAKVSKPLCTRCQVSLSTIKESNIQEGILASRTQGAVPIQPSDHNIQMLRQEKTLIELSSDEYDASDSDATLSAASSDDDDNDYIAVVKRDPLTVIDSIEVDISPPQSQRSSPSVCVITREMTNPFEVVLRGRASSTDHRNPLARHSPDLGTSPDRAEDTPSRSPRREKQKSSCGTPIPLWTEMAPLGHVSRKLQAVPIGATGYDTDSSYGETQRQKRRPARRHAARIVPRAPSAARRSRAMSRFSREPSVMLPPPTAASRQRQASIAKARQRKKNAGKRMRPKSRPMAVKRTSTKQKQPKIAAPTKSFRDTGLDMDKFLCLK